MIDLSINMERFARYVSKIIANLILIISYFFLGTIIIYVLDLKKILSGVDLPLTENLPHFGIYYELFQVTLIVTVGYAFIMIILFLVKNVSYLILSSKRGSYIAVYHVNSMDGPYFLIGLEDLKNFLNLSLYERATLNLLMGLFILFTFAMISISRMLVFIISVSVVTIGLIILNYITFPDKISDYIKALFLDISIKSHLLRMYLERPYRRLLEVRIVKKKGEERKINVSANAVMALKRILKEISLLQLLEGKIDTETYVLLLNEIESLNNEILTLALKDYIKAERRSQ